MRVSEGLACMWVCVRVSARPWGVAFPTRRYLIRFIGAVPVGVLVELSG